MSDGEPSSGTGRLLMGVAWAVLLLGLWLWGSDLTDVPGGLSGPTTGDVAAVGRPLEVELPPAAHPLSSAAPQRLDIPSIQVQAPVVPRGLDRDGAVDPPPYDQSETVGWYQGGPAPGAPGAALLVAHLDTDSRPAVFHRLSALRPGAKIRVTRADGTLAEFTVDDIEVQSRDHFDAGQVYGPHQQGRAELRLITCGGRYDRSRHAYTANVVVSAYLTHG
ncbi:class F sortase [Streptomyces sp. NPDC002004]